MFGGPLSSDGATVSMRRGPLRADRGSCGATQRRRWMASSRRWRSSVVRERFFTFLQVLVDLDVSCVIDMASPITCRSKR